jgi:hypothetical protein
LKLTIFSDVYKPNNMTTVTLSIVFINFEIYLMWSVYLEIKTCF